MNIPKKYVEETIKISNANELMIKKDLVISYILQEISTNIKLNKLVFKGGTLLAKGYLNYHRFSEDIDFTYNKIFSGTNTAIRKNIKDFIKNTFLPVLQKICDKYNLDFKSKEINEKNKKYCPVKSSIDLWYFNVYLDNKDKNPIKIEIKFQETLLYEVKKTKLSNINPNSKYLTYPLKETKINSYNIKEVIIEKIRAILTRDEIKERDFFDLFLLNKEINIFNINKENILNKLKNKEVYFENLKNTKFTDNIEYLAIKEFKFQEYIRFCRDLEKFIESLFKKSI